MNHQELTVREEAFLERARGLASSFETIQQGRSNFALRHFVVGQHDTPARQWAQGVLELEVKMLNIERQRLDLEELQLDMEAIQAEAPKDGLEKRRSQIKLARLEIQLQEIAWHRLGAIREAETLLALIQEIESVNGGPFSREDLERQESEYWTRRLTRQALIHSRPSGGDVDAILQTITEPGVNKPLLKMTANDIAALVPLLDDGELAKLKSSLDDKLLPTPSNNARALKPAF